MFFGIRKPKNTAVFISGGGSTLQALLELRFQLNIGLVVSNKQHNLGLLKAKRSGCITYHFGKEKSYTELSKVLKSRQIEQIFLAGYMRILPTDFVNSWQNKIFNIHPSLLPDFAGLEATEKSFEAKGNMGVTIHKVTAEIDTGPRFLQTVSAAATCTSQMNFTEAQFFLRRSEQHLLREFAYRRAV